jgi:hypothetical protein
MSRPRFLADHDLNEHIVYGVLRRESVGPVIDDVILIWSASEAEGWQNVVAFLPLV